MSDFSNWPSIFRCCSLTTSACGLACVAAMSAYAKDPRLIYRQDTYVRIAKSSIHSAFEAQAMKARTLSNTLWNYHFQEDSDELRPSGREQLDRMARRYPFAFPEVYVQSAHDFQILEGGLDAYIEHRNELNDLRTKAVSEYLKRILQNQTVAIQIHDRPTVGMSGNETRAAYSSMIEKAPSGLLPVGITASRFEFGAGASGGGFDFGTGGLNSSMSSSPGGSPFSSLGGVGPPDLGAFDSGAPPFSSFVPSGMPGGSSGMPFGTPIPTGMPIPTGLPPAP